MNDDKNGILDFPVNDAAQERLAWYEEAKTFPDRWFRELRQATQRADEIAAERQQTAGGFQILPASYLPLWPEFQLGPPVLWDNGLELALLGSAAGPPLVGLQWPIAHWMSPLCWWYRDNRTLVLPDATGGREFDVEQNDLVFWIEHLKDKTGLLTKTHEALGEFAIAWVAWEKWIRPNLEADGFFPKLGEMPNIVTGFEGKGTD